LAYKVYYKITRQIFYRLL